MSMHCTCHRAPVDTVRRRSTAASSPSMRAVEYRRGADRYAAGHPLSWRSTLGGVTTVARGIRTAKPGQASPSQPSVPTRAGLVVQHKPAVPRRSTAGSRRQDSAALVMATAAARDACRCNWRAYRPSAISRAYRIRRATGRHRPACFGTLQGFTAGCRLTVVKTREDQSEEVDRLAPETGRLLRTSRLAGRRGKAGLLPARRRARIPAAQAAGGKGGSRAATGGRSEPPLEFTPRSRTTTGWRICPPIGVLGDGWWRRREDRQSRSSRHAGRR